MQSTTPHITEAPLEWKPCADVQAVVFVGKANSKPIAIIELRPGHGFHVTMCSGESLGQFDSLADGQAAVAARVDRHARAAA